ncbi:MAG TPA: hypothetical protein VFE38_11450 [Edaphobacter sp.]|nr:hypothetical protein [Edaphobacter sp.]
MAQGLALLFQGTYYFVAEDGIGAIDNASDRVIESCSHKTLLSSSGQTKRPAVIDASFALTTVTAIVAVGGIFTGSALVLSRGTLAQSGDISTEVFQTFDLDEQRKEFAASGFMLVFVLENLRPHGSLVGMGNGDFIRSRLSETLRAQTRRTVLYRASQITPESDSDGRFGQNPGEAVRTAYKQRTNHVQKSP